MTPSGRRLLRRGIAAGATVILIAAVTVALVRTSGDDEKTVTAIFDNAEALVPGNEVKMAGVEVGSIDSIELRNGRAEVKMTLERLALPLHQDATARIRLVSLLGERYIDLDRGSPDKPLMSDTEVLRVGKEHSAVDLDEVLNALDDPTSASLAALVTALGEGTDGQGKNIDAALKALAPAMSDTARLGQVLDEQNDVLAQLVDRTTPVARSLARGHGKDLDKLVESTKQGLWAVALERRALDDALRQLPATLRQARHSLAQVAGVSKAATPTLRAARPVTDELPQITSELDAFVAAADPALGSLPPVLNRAETLLDQTAPLVRDLRPGAEALNSVAGSARPIVDRLSQHFVTIMDFVKGWALSTNGEDGISNYFRGFVQVTPKQLLQAPAPALGPGKAPAERTGPPQPAQPPEKWDPLRQTIPDQSGTQDPDSATGLSPQQEDSLMDQLLGGQ